MGEMVFISHAGPQKDRYALPLRRDLENRGVTAFVDDRDLPAGGSSGPHMEAACRGAKLVIFLITRDFLQREWCMLELRWALDQRHSKGDRKLPEVLPVFLPVSGAAGEPFLNVDDLSPVSKEAKELLQLSRPLDALEGKWAKDCELDLACLLRFGAVRSDAYPARSDLSAAPVHSEHAQIQIQLRRRSRVYSRVRAGPVCA